MRLVPLVLLAACSGSASSSPGDTDTVPPSVVDTSTTRSTTTSTTDTDVTVVPPTGDFNGTVPASSLPLPTFASVTNRDGTVRVPADLVGHPTVMWFYPAANTGG